MSPLQQRLDHLVNYSSQLIFVSGETIAEQQRHLEQFLVQQHDDTEVAFLQLDEDSNDFDIRHRIASQLIQIEPDAVNRPINEVLHQLNNFDGPILICITQAQFMSSSLLNELWDLVLQSRFANNKQHLNVILFAESKWAKRAQDVLPARNTNQPLLFSSDTFDARPARDSLLNHPDHTDEVEADNFQLYRQAKRINHFLLSLVIVLCAALGVSIYLHVDQAVLQQLSALPQPAAPAVNSLDVNRPNVNRPDVNNPAVNPVVKSNDDDVSSTQTNSTQTTALLKPAINSETLALKEELAGFWQPSSIDKPQNDGSPEIQVQGTVPTLLSEPAQPALTVLPTTPISSNPVADVSAMTVPNVTETLPPEIVAMYDNATMMMLDDDAWVLQLVGMTSIAKLEQFITDFALEEQSWIYYTERFGGDWFVLVLNSSFNSRQDALSRVNSLPPEIIASAPFAKTVRRVKDELRTLNEVQ